MAYIVTVAGGYPKPKRIPCRKHGAVLRFPSRRSALAWVRHQPWLIDPRVEVEPQPDDDATNLVVAVGCCFALLQAIHTARWLLT